MKIIPFAPFIVAGFETFRTEGHDFQADYAQCFFCMNEDGRGQGYAVEFSSGITWPLLVQAALRLLFKRK